MDTLYDFYIEACNPIASPNRLRELAQDCRAVIRARVAENIYTPLDVLEQLSVDPSPDVRMSVTLNNAAPVVLRWVLATDPCPDVRFAIAENSHTAMAILVWLTADENPYVAWRAEETIEAVTNDGSKQGGNDMSATRIERTLRRALNKKDRLNKADALRLKQMVLADGYLSRSERNIMVQAVEHDLLDEDAFDIFVDVLLQKSSGRGAEQSIA
jgi:hypothetical protein